MQKLNPGKISAVLTLAGVGVGAFCWVARIEPSRDPVANTAPAQAAQGIASQAQPPGLSNEVVKTGDGHDLTSGTQAALTGAAATAELRKGGHYQALGGALAAARHAVEKIDPAGPHSRGAEYFAANPGQQLRAWFSRDGVELASGNTPPAGGEPWSVTLRLSGVGRAKSVRSVGGGSVSGAGQRVEVRYPAAALTQWFENRREGVEQGFTLQQPPVGGTGEVMIVLDVGGTLHAEAMDGQGSVRLADASGAEVLRYAGLKAWDATGRGLLARMELRVSGLALVVADAGASYPVTIDPLFANVEARLTEDAIAGDNFGSSVALVGDTALVGAPYDTTAAGFRAGSAYLFVRSGTVWNQQARFTAPDGTSQDRFGWSVALAGDTALIGSPSHTTASGAGAGSAYLFVRNGATWIQQAQLAAADGASADGFGWAVALAGDTALVGAHKGDTAAGTDAGSVYVFGRNGGVWEPQGKLTANDGAPNDLFGNSVALAGDTALVGASGDDTEAATDAGSAYVFTRAGALWTQEAKLSASDGSNDDQFGNAVALAGDTALVGDSADETTGMTHAGSAYVFVRNGTAWCQQAKLMAADAAANDWFGCAVALVGDTALLGAYHDDGIAGVDVGSAYVFVRNGTAWSQQAKLTSAAAAANDWLGGAVALADDTALVGAALDDLVGGADAGSAQVFVRNGLVWSEQALLTASDVAAYDNFGAAVALAGDTALVGVPNDDSMAGVNAGSMYVFVRNGMVWNNQAKLTVADAASNEHLGIAVALSGDTALAGADGGGTSAVAQTGSAYVFVRSGINWTQQARLTAEDAAESDGFGSSVALAGTTALVGAAKDDTAAGADAGSAYVFVRNGATWLQQAKLTGFEAGPGEWFGWSVALSGETALLGAPFANTVAGWAAGSAQVFVRGGGVWNYQASLNAADAAANDWFGWSVALAGDTALAGVPYGHTESGTNTGSAYLFGRSGAAWSQRAKLTASDAAAGDGFGSSVALTGDTAMVGAPNDDVVAGLNAGGAYVFARSGAVWNQQVKLTAGLDASSYDNFGSCVALAGDAALVGAANDDTAAYRAGSAYAFLLGELPAITLQPVSRTVVPGQAVTFGVTATGFSPLQYQWRKDGYWIPGATAASHSIPSARPGTSGDEGSYDCVVSNIGGVATSAPALLRVNALSQFSQGFPGVATEVQGFVVVALTPAGIGGWRFAGEQQWRASGMPVGGLAAGDREIEFRPLPGYLHPPPETVSVTGGVPVTVERAYYLTDVAGSGGISVTLKPESLAAPGVPAAERAQWRFLGEDETRWRDSGATTDGLVPGSYLIECRPVAGRTTPPSINVWVADRMTTVPVLTYFLVDAASGTPPVVLPFETVSTGGNLPYAYVGQLRGSTGSGTGFVVKPRVVASAGHMVFDDGALAAVSGLQWLFQRDSGSHEPLPQRPRGFYLFSGYAAQRTLEASPGTSSPQSQELDVAALYFTEDAGRGGFGGYLASDAEDNEFLLSPALKTLVGYPVDGVPAGNVGRMHATPAAAISFAPGGSAHTYTTAAIRSFGGNSGGPLCVQFEGGAYFPAALYLGGTGQTVVRAIDSGVIRLFEAAADSAATGNNNTGGGITLTSVTPFGTVTLPGVLRVLIEPAAARAANGRWSLLPETLLRLSGTQKTGLTPGTYTLEFPPLAGFAPPLQQTVPVTGGAVTEFTFTYAAELPELDAWRMTHFGTQSNTGRAADAADPDGDGQSNINEFAAGTDPNNPADSLRMLTTSYAGGAFTLTLAAKAGRIYHLEVSLDLADDHWTTKASVGPFAAGVQAALTDYEAPAERAFYRVRVAR